MKGTCRALFKALVIYFPGGNEENHKNSQDCRCLDRDSNRTLLNTSQKLHLVVYS
jgi:hypothetical protein